MRTDKVFISEPFLRSGEVSIHGYKHAMVQIIAAAVSLNQRVIISNPPKVDDTFVMMDIVSMSGGLAELDSTGALIIDPQEMTNSTIDSDLSKKIHGSLYLVPAYASRFRMFNFQESGGCQIGGQKSLGKRPTSQVIDILERAGFEVSVEPEKWIGTQHHTVESVEIDILDYATDRKTASGSRISGATKTALLCAPLFQKIRLHHPYLKTDVQDLLRFFKGAGYQVFLSPSEVFVSAISTPQSQTFTLSDCPSEVMTYITFAVLSDIDLTLKIENGDRLKSSLKMEIELLEHMGVPVHIKEKCVLIGKAKKISPLNIIVNNNTIMSDHQPFFALMLTKATGQSTITETVWRERFAYASVLAQHGAGFSLEDNKLTIIPGTFSLEQKEVEATDTRMAAILLLASVCFGKHTLIKGINHAYRGYESLIEDLNGLGAMIEYKT